MAKFLERCSKQWVFPGTENCFCSHYKFQLYNRKDTLRISFWFNATSLNVFKTWTLSQPFFLSSDTCIELSPHSHTGNHLKPLWKDNLFRPRMSLSLPERERDFKRSCWTTFQRCRKQGARSLANRTNIQNRFILGQHLGVGQKVLHEYHHQGLSKTQNLEQRQLVTYTVFQRVTNTTYQTQNGNDTTITKTVHRHHIVEKYHKEETLPPKIDEYVRVDKRQGDFFEKPVEQWLQKLNNPEKT